MSILVSCDNREYKNICWQQSSICCIVAVVMAVLVVNGTRADRYHPVNPALRSAPVPNAEELNPQYWAQQAEQAIKARSKLIEPRGKARNVILFLGDGMSVPTLTAARIYSGQQRGATGEEAELFFESFPTTGLLKTYCANSQVGDSACTATAYLCGVKTNTGCIGVSAAVERGDCAAARKSANQVQSIGEWALADGRDVGLVTTARVTHASPSGMYAKVPERGWEDDVAVKKAGHKNTTCPDIAYQLVHMNPGNKFKVILGGGRRNFLPVCVKDEEGFRGIRKDGQNLIEDWRQSKIKLNATYKYIWNRDQLMTTNNDLPQYLLGLFEASHMQFNLVMNKTTEPTLAELTETAIKILRRNNKGFFLFVEGGRIDHGHHDNRVQFALDETVQLSAAVERAASLLSQDDTLIVVTADHAHVMSINGYSNRGHDILGLSRNTDNDKAPYMTLSYTNGPGFYKQTEKGVRPDVTKLKNFGTLQWRSHVDIPVSAETHGGDDVAVFALGPHHSMFSGLYEQSQLPYRMAWAACFGPGSVHCAGRSRLILPNAGAIHWPLEHLHCLTLLALLAGTSVYFFERSIN